MQLRGDGVKSGYYWCTCDAGNRFIGKVDLSGEAIWLGGEKYSLDQFFDYVPVDVEGTSAALELLRNGNENAQLAMAGNPNACEKIIATVDAIINKNRQIAEAMQ